MNCNGGDSTILSNSQCTIPLSILTAVPFSLTNGDSIRVKVIATNVKGDSEESLVGNGATIITSPDAPINFVEDT